MTYPTTPVRAWDVADPGVLELSGYLDSDNAKDLEEDALLCIQSGARELVLDCEGMTFISSAGMQCLLHIAREMRAAHGKLVACNLQPQVKDMFDACGLSHFIPVYDDQMTAKLSLVA